MAPPVERPGRTACSGRRHLLVALALAASTALPGSVAVPAATSLASLSLASAPAAPAAVGAGHALPPIVVSAPAAARWRPWSRRRPVRHHAAARPAARPAAHLAAAPVAAPAAPPASAPVPVPAGSTGNRAPEHAASYTFMSETAPGQPIAWDPCNAVHWVFNPSNAPAGGLAAVQAAIARVSAATGLTFTYDGTTTAVPTSSYLDSSTSTYPPLLVGWSTPAASTLLANQPANLVGMDQAIWVRPASGATHVVSGVVALNAQVHAATAGANSWLTFALHELGHSVGMGHTTDPTQIMAPMIPAAASDYGSGDLAGLARLGGTC